MPRAESAVNDDIGSCTGIGATTAAGVAGDGWVCGVGAGVAGAAVEEEAVEITGTGVGEAAAGVVGAAVAGAVEVGTGAAGTAGAEVEGVKEGARRVVDGAVE